MRRGLQGERSRDDDIAQRGQQHEIMLRQELRKLREADMAKIKERNKRLEMNRKLKIIEKEKNSQNALEIVKKNDQLVQLKKL